MDIILVILLHPLGSEVFTGQLACVSSYVDVN